MIHAGLNQVTDLTDHPPKQHAGVVVVTHDHRVEETKSSVGESLRQTNATQDNRCVTSREQFVSLNADLNIVSLSTCPYYLFDFNY